MPLSLAISQTVPKQWLKTSILGAKRFGLGLTGWFSAHHMVCTVALSSQMGWSGGFRMASQSYPVLCGG